MIEQFASYFTKLEQLSSDELLRSAEKLVVSEHTTIAKLIAHLAEMSSRKTALKLGYSSLYDYCITRLNLSEGAVPARIHVANVSRRFPQIRNAVDVPVVLKGVMSESDATKAAELAMDGIVISNFGGLIGGSKSAPLPELLAIRRAVSSELPILVDGSFRRATDILVALILGAQGVLLGRPIMWALASYGAEGVTTLIKMLQRDVARCFAMLGASNLQALTRSHLKIHARR